MSEYAELNRFKDDFFKEMKKLWEEKRDCDVTIIIGKEKFLCHRIILSLASSYFRKLFYGDFKEKNSKEVVLHDLDAEAFKIILKAIYTGVIKLSYSSYPSKNSSRSMYQLLKTSSFLNITAIEDECVDYILETTSTDYLIEICMLSNVIGRDDLFVGCIKRIADDFLHFSKVDAFRNLPFDILKSVLRKVNESTQSDVVLLAIMDWSKFNRADTRTVERLLEVTKLTKISAVTHANLITTTNDRNDGKRNRKKPKLSCAHEHEGYYDDPHPAIKTYVSAIDTENSMKGAIGFRLDAKMMKWRMDSFSFKYSVDFYVKVATVENVGYNLWYKDFFDFNVLMKKVNGVEDEVSKHPTLLMKRYHMLAGANRLFVFSIDPHVQYISLYDCDSNTWSTIDMPAEGYLDRGFAVAQSDSKIYIFGIKKMIWHDFVYCLDCRTLNFTAISEMPNLHTGAAAYAHGGKIYLCGFSDDEESSRRFSSFDIRTREWRSLARMKYGRAFNHQLVYHENYLYVLDCHPLKSPERYNIASDKWSNIPSIPSLAHYDFRKNPKSLAVGELFDVTVTTEVDCLYL